MVAIDTNIVSELMRAEPSAEVPAWMDDRPPRELFVTAATRNIGDFEDMGIDVFDP